MMLHIIADAHISGTVRIMTQQLELMSNLNNREETPGGKEYYVVFLILF